MFLSSECPNIIAGQQRMVHTVQMRGNYGGIRRFSADVFYILEIHDKPAYRHSCRAAIQNDHIREVLVNGLLHTAVIHGIPNN